MGIEDKAEAKGTEFVGKAKEEFGQATGNEDLENEGRAQKTEGKLKDFAEDVKDKAQDAGETLKDKAQDAGATIKEAFSKDDK